MSEINDPLKLMPCPWCGEPLSSVSVSEGSTFRWRKVDGCCTDGPEVRHDTMADDQEAAEADSRHRAIEAWNARAPATVTDEDVERAMEAADLVFAKHFGTRPDADEIDTAMVRAALESFANKETP